MPIARYDDPVLRKKSRPLAQGEFAMPEFKQFVANLVATMKAYRGAGISAIQCGVPMNIIVIAEEFCDIVMVNPVIKEVDAQEVEADEGCLSFPGAFVKVTRPKAVKVAYQDQNGNVQERVLTDIQARAVQHEIEHLEGELLIDHVRTIDRPAFRQKLTKFERTVRKFNPSVNTNKLPSKKKRQQEKKAARKAGRKVGRS